MFIVIVGSPIEGFGYIGPFQDEESVVKFMTSQGTEHLNWWIADLTDPKEWAAWMRSPTKNLVALNKIIQGDSDA